MISVWNDANSVMAYRYEAAFNIHKQIFQYDLKGIIGSLFILGKELWRNRTLNQHTYGKVVCFDVTFKVSVLKLYRHMGSSNYTRQELGSFLDAFSKISYHHFLKLVDEESEILKKASFMNNEESYDEHLMDQLSYFNNMMLDFEDNNYLIPFVINKNKPEFENAYDGIERRMCAILSEDLLLDFCFDHYNCEFNAYSAEKIPTMSREFYKACEPFYKYIYKELFE